MENPIKIDDLGVPLFLEIAISMNKPLINRCSGTRPPKLTDFLPLSGHQGLPQKGKQII